MLEASSPNPLLSLRPEVEIPFERIFGEHVTPAIDALLAEAQEKLDALVADIRPRTYETTLGALEAVTERLDFVMGVVSHLESVATTPALRAAYNAVQPAVSAFFSGLALSEGVYSALKRYAETDEGRALQGTRRRFLDKTIADFKRSGAELAAEDKARLSAMDVELATLTLRYGQNVLDATNAFELVIEDDKRLAGLPESAVAAARASAAQKGRAGFRFTLQAPSYVPAMTYLDDRALREQLYRAFTTRATSGDLDNRPIVRKILELRRAKARLLGFSHFADLVLEDRMAKTGEAARRFIATLNQAARQAFEREHEELAAFHAELDGEGAPKLAPWDVSYYAEKLRKARFDFDDEALRPYFPLEGVLEGAFAIAERLYGVQITAWEGASVWHPSVRAYLMREPDGHASAAFYVDVAPRESKRDGAWMQGLVTSIFSVPEERHLEVLAGNMTLPLEDRPALLHHREVATVFHEFGHLMHHASSRVEVRALAGTNVAWDFVELPSQIMENWCWEREALDLFARHYKTSATIPDALLESMRAARTFRAATAMLRQLGFAEVDLALHMDWDPESGVDPVTFGREVIERYSPVRLPEDHAMLAAFGHLFASPVGYAAGYYSYKWAEVLDADAFSRFKHEGLWSREVGAAFRAEILSRGDSDDPMALYRRFMGREPRLEALLERDGLVAATTGAL
jgi:oligopeptidase A